MVELSGGTATDAQWAKMEPHCLGKRTDPGRSGHDNRLFLEAVLWKARTSSPWRDLPKEFGDWNTIFKRFDYWSERGVFEHIFEAVSEGLSDILCKKVMGHAV